ncbi:unnamed protein product [Paramecium octaurelia]|uniref:Uncharacterized protein n=1 Tax=Paramecium octaurelia TaxID=43137 RepID=A0A8S1Y3T8_PAROT|nr:unnamed protein product [Paramecium octaurelia]
MYAYTYVQMQKKQCVIKSLDAEMLQTSEQIGIKRITPTSCKELMLLVIHVQLIQNQSLFLEQNIYRSYASTPWERHF